MPTFDQVAVTFTPAWGDPGGPDTTVLGIRHDGALHRTYSLQVHLLIADSDIEPGVLLGTNATVTIARGTVARDIHGIVARVEEGAKPRPEDQAFTVTLVPALEALAHRKDSRIFQQQNVLQILTEVLQTPLQEYGRSIDTSALSQDDYPILEYAVQYAETDLAFVERVMAEYGIGYYFDHAGETEKLVLFSDARTLPELENVAPNNPGVLPAAAREDVSAVQRECVAWFRLQSQMRPTAATTRVFNWFAEDQLYDESNASASSPTDADREVDGARFGPAREMYEHDAPTTSWCHNSDQEDFTRVETQTRLRRELHRRDALKGAGESTAIFLRPGVRFDLQDHEHGELNGEYFVTSVTTRWGVMAGEASPGPNGSDFRSRFQALPAGFEWRPDRSRRKPRIFGIQTATVVGNAGQTDEIHTDVHGRIRVRFHWDRVNPQDSSASCYIRVVQSWAGQNFGTLFLPRIGMEVAVTFVDGDPDRPIVTGCLYNGNNPTPYTLDDDTKTRSVIQTKAIGEGEEGYHELSFDDDPATGEVYLRSQLDLREEVYQDHTTTVSRNQTEWVQGHQKLTVGSTDQSETPAAAGDRLVTVRGDFTEYVDGQETRTVGGDVSTTFQANETHDVTSNQTETVGGNVERTVTGNVTDNVTGNVSQTVTGSIDTTTSSSLSIDAATGITMNTLASMDVTATGGFTLTAPGGIDVVDSSYWSISTSSGTFSVSTQNIFAHQLNVALIMKNDINNILTTFNMLNWTASGIDIANAAVAVGKNGVDLTNKQMEMEVAQLAFKVSQLQVIN